MAFIGQEKKAEIAAELKRAVPKGWKYTLAIRHHSTLVFTLVAAPHDLIGPVAQVSSQRFSDVGESIRKAGYVDLNVYAWDHTLAAVEPEARAVLDAIREAMYRGNHDRSDIQSDYFDVGWYVDIRFGKYGRPFVDTSAPQQVAA